MGVFGGASPLHGSSQSFGESGGGFGAVALASPLPALAALPLGIAVWYDAGRGVTTDENGRVTTWDSIARPLSAKQNVTGSMPIFEGTGRVGIRYDGVNDSLSFGENSILSGKPGATVFVVSNPEAISTEYRRILIFGVPGGPTSTRLSLNYDPTGGAGGPSVIARVVDAAPTIGFSSNNPAPPSLSLDTYRVRLLSGTVRMFRNGVPFTGEESLGGAGSFPNTLSGGGYVGSNAGGNSFKGTFHEIVLYDRALSDAEQLQVEAYLRAKWGTP